MDDGAIYGLTAHAFCITRPIYVRVYLLNNCPTRSAGHWSGVCALVALQNTASMTDVWPACPEWTWLVVVGTFAAVIYGWGTGASESI